MYQLTRQFALVEVVIVVIKLSKSLWRFIYNKYYFVTANGSVASTNNTIVNGYISYIKSIGYKIDIVF